MVSSHNVISAIWIVVGNIYLIGSKGYGLVGKDLFDQDKCSRGARSASCTVLGYAFI